MTDRRETVRDGARYLRGVRPIDPEEVATYVEGGAHPGVVRQDLRSMATDLGVIERSDGTFVPVPEGPVEPDLEAVEGLPEAHVRRLSDRFVEAWGPGWPSGETGERVAETVRSLKADYEAGRSVTYDRDVALAYAYYHLPTHYAAATYVSQELVRDGLLGHDLRVLDVGAGVGGPALALADLLPEDALVEYHAVEPAAAAADVLTSLLEGTGRNVHLQVHRERAQDHDPAGEFDLVLLSSVLSELADPAAVAARYLEAVAADGTMALVATGDRVTSTTLRGVERTLVDERDLASAYAPTVRLWPGERPTDRGWSWTRAPDLAVPSFQAALADGDDSLRNTSVRYSWALLRPDGRRRYPGTLDRADRAPMADADAHVTDRIDLAGAKLSPDLGTGNPLYKVSDGSEAVDHYAVLVHESELTRTLRTAPYGAVLSMENVLLLYNDDEEGYNAVVDDEAVVEYLDPGST